MSSSLGNSRGREFAARSLVPTRLSPLACPHSLRSRTYTTRLSPCESLPVNDSRTWTTPPSLTVLMRMPTRQRVSKTRMQSTPHSTTPIHAPLDDSYTLGQDDLGQQTRCEQRPHTFVNKGGSSCEHGGRRLCLTPSFWEGRNSRSNILRSRQRS